MQNDQCSDPVKPDLLNQVYLRPRARRHMARIKQRGEQLMALAAELDEAVCDEKPPAVLREYVFAIEYVAAELQAICVRFDLDRRNWNI